MTMSEVPKVGDEIYVPTALYMSHGADDFCGGLAKVSEVTESTSGGRPAQFIRIEERPHWLYNWHFLAEKQEELREQWGSSRAHPDPDYREEFNRWD